jgi:hypothetical protein
MKSSKMKSSQIKSLKMTLRDYKNVLKFYKIDTEPLTNKAIKEKAEHFLAVKLCKCIKNIRAGTGRAGTGTGTGRAGTGSEKRAISICYNSVLTKKNLKVFKFTCKKKAKLLPKKGTRKMFVEHNSAYNSLGV